MNALRPLIALFGATLRGEPWGEPAAPAFALASVQRDVQRIPPEFVSFAVLLLELLNSRGM